MSHSSSVSTKAVPSQAMQSFWGTNSFTLTIHNYSATFLDLLEHGSDQGLRSCCTYELQAKLTDATMRAGQLEELGATEDKIDKSDRRQEPANYARVKLVTNRCFVVPNTGSR